MYLVHLTAPGWNVIGAARPWLPGIVTGHNERIAWAMTPLGLDTQDIVVERVNPSDPHQVLRAGRWVDMSVDFERVAVKGRDRPVEYERQYTSNGVVIAQDKQRSLVYTLRWTGTEPGGAGELAALDLGRADSLNRFRDTLDRWTAPPSEFVYADIDGFVGRRQAGLIPQRRRSGGAAPSAGWSNDRIWLSLSRLDSTGDVPPALVELTSVDIQSRAVLAALNSVDGIRALPEDVARTLDRLRAVGSRTLLLRFFHTVRRLALERGRVPNELRDEVLYAVDPATADVNPQAAMFGGESSGRTDLLISALRLVGDLSNEPLQNAPVTFEHPLAVFDNARLRFNVGAVVRPTPPGSGSDSPASADPSSRPSFRARFDTSGWDRSIAINAPGQSGSPASADYDDLAARWASGEDVPLAFTQFQVNAAARDVLTLNPRPR
jgi:penicillin amidase